MWLLDPAAKLATVTAVLIVLAPRIRDAFYRLTHAPKESVDDRMERLKLLFSDGRSGFFERWCFKFLDWCRTEDDDKLTWREKRARAVWCPLFRHKVIEIDRPGQRYGARCRRCWAYFTHDTAEGLEKIRRSGKVPSGFRSWHVRERS